jgi:hypothetical protein
MTVKPVWARKRDRPPHSQAEPSQADRPLWRLTVEDQRVLLITFAGGLGAIVVGAGMIGAALAFGRFWGNPPWVLAIWTVVYLFTVLLMRYRGLFRRGPGDNWSFNALVITAVFSGSFFLLRGSPESVDTLTWLILPIRAS